MYSGTFEQTRVAEYWLWKGAHVGPTSGLQVGPKEVPLGYVTWAALRGPTGGLGVQTHGLPSWDPLWAYVSGPHKVSPRRLNPFVAISL